jgi:hypothetical protein
MPGLFFESRDCGNTSLAGFNIDALSAPPLTSHLGRYFVSLTVHRECTDFPDKTPALGSRPEPQCGLIWS